VARRVQRTGRYDGCYTATDAARAHNNNITTTVIINNLTYKSPQHSSRYVKTTCGTASVPIYLRGLRRDDG